MSVSEWNYIFAAGLFCLNSTTKPFLLHHQGEVFAAAGGNLVGIIINRLRKSAGFVARYENLRNSDYWDGRDTVGGAHHHFLKLFYEDLSGRRLLTASVNQLQLIQTMPGPTQRAGMLCFQLPVLELRLGPTGFWRSHGGRAFQVEDLVCCRLYTLNRTRQVWETSTTGSDSTTGEKHGMLVGWLSRSYRVG